MKCLIILSAVLICAASECSGDTVTLNNDNVLTGVITEETEDYIVLNIGAGTITLKHAEIKSIDKADNTANVKMMQDWKKKYFESYPAPTPEDEEILSGLGDLKHARTKLLKNIARGDYLDKEIARIGNVMSELRKDQSLVAQQLEETDAEKNVSIYNSLVARFTQVSNKLVDMREEQNKYQKKQKDAYTQSAGYIDQLTDFREKFGKRYKAIIEDKEASDERRDFYNLLKAGLEKMEEDVEDHEIAYKRKGSGIMVTALLNDKAYANLVVDTGASLVIVSQKAARKLDVLYDDIKEDVTLVLANGKPTEAKFYLLDSVKVGNVELRNVNAAISKTRPSAGVDGLLGMSFLEKFSFTINAKEKKLVLKTLRH